MFLVLLLLLLLLLLSFDFRVMGSELAGLEFRLGVRGSLPALRVKALGFRVEDLGFWV